MTRSKPVRSATQPRSQAMTPPTPATTAATRPTAPTRATTRATRRTPGTAAAPAHSADPVELTLGPVSLEEFLGDAFERRPLTIGRSEPGRFDEVLSVAAVEHLICATGIRAPAFRLVADGGPVPLREYTDDV